MYFFPLIYIYIFLGFILFFMILETSVWKINFCYCTYIYDLFMPSSKQLGVWYFLFDYIGVNILTLR